MVIILALWIVSGFRDNNAMTTTQPFLAIFDDVDEPLKIPGWFNNLISLGTSLEDWDQSKGKLVVVVTSPIARYAAVAISLGITLNRLKRFKALPSKKIEILADLKVGDLISIRAGDKQVIGKFFGIENENELRIGPSRYKLQKVNEIHPVKAYSEIRQKPHLLGKRKSGTVSNVTDPEENHFSEANSHIVVVGDKLNVTDEYQLNIGLFRPATPEDLNYESMADVVKVKGIREALGWSCEVLSRDEFLVTEGDFSAPHLIISNNRNCSELSEYSFNQSKILLLDSRDSLESALFSIQAYSQYCRRIDPSEIGWTPDKAFRGIVMVENNV
jgi:hypothetical protein